MSIDAVRALLRLPTRPLSTQRSMFKSPEGRTQYLAAYDATLALWPVPVESFDVPTRFGNTHVNACGPEGAPPVLLLHGLGVSSTMWYPNVAGLSRSYRVYALDTIGDAGKSVCTRSLRTRSDFVDWLADVFRELRVEKAHVAGMSYGGFLALNLALSEPDRVTKLVLLAPAACLLPFVPRFYLKVILMGLPVRALRLSVLRSMFARPIVKGAPVVEQFLMGRHFRGDLHVHPRLYSDDELRRVRAPTLLLLGEGEIIYDPRAALKRAASLIPDLEAAIIPGARHGVSLDQPEIVNRRILEFLKKRAA